MSYKIWDRNDEGHGEKPAFAGRRYNSLSYYVPIASYRDLTKSPAYSKSDLPTVDRSACSRQVDYCINKKCVILNLK